MKVSSRTVKNVGIIKFEEDKVLGIEAGEFQESLLTLLDNNIKSVVIDLSGVKFLSSWGIGMLMHGLATTTNRGAVYKLASLNSKVIQTLKNVRIYSVLDIHDSVESAMK